MATASSISAGSNLNPPQSGHRVSRVPLTRLRPIAIKSTAAYNSRKNLDPS